MFPGAEVVVRSDAAVGEGPVFDPRTGRLCWVDITGGVLHENDLATGGERQWPLDTMLGAAVPRAEDNGFAVAVSGGFGVVVDGALELLDPVLPEPSRRMNDAKCDSRGRLWAGSTHLEFRPGQGTLHRWNGAEPSAELASGFTLPNGLGWNADDTTMYLVDSMAHRLLSTPFESDEGRIGDFTEVASIVSGIPDGLAVDVDGCIWVALWGGSEVQRFDPRGNLIGRVPVPVSQPSSCAFGPDGTLYITSARADIPEAKLANEPLAGSVFAVATNTIGVPVAPFAG